MKYRIRAHSLETAFAEAWELALRQAKHSLAATYLTVTGIRRNKTKSERAAEAQALQQSAKFIHIVFGYGMTQMAVWMELIEKAKEDS